MKIRNVWFRNLLLLVLALGVGVSAIGCATNRPAGAQIDDAEITASVKTRLLADPEVGGLNIDVDTLKGVVTLSGMVKTAAEKAEAGELAAGTEHVRSVRNNLQIQP